MVTCEICGKETRTSQGLREHKTFVHGIRAHRSRMPALVDRLERADETRSELETDNSRLIISRKELANLVSEVAKMEHTIGAFKKTLEKLESYIALLAT